MMIKQGTKERGTRGPTDQEEQGTGSTSGASGVLDFEPIRCNTFCIEVHLTPEQEARLAQIASLEGIEPEKLVQHAVSRLIEDLEDLKIAEERLTELREGRSTTHSLDEVERDLGLAS